MKLYKLIPLLYVDNVTVCIKDLDENVLDVYTIECANCDILDKHQLVDILRLYGDHKIISLNFNTTAKALIIKINKRV